MSKQWSKYRWNCSVGEHLPYSAWCPVCVKARGREDQHKAKESDEQAVVKVSMELFSWRTFTIQCMVSSVREGQRQGGPAQGKGVR